MTEYVNILTPVGRLVQGDCWDGVDKDAEGNPLVYKTGPNIGQPRKQWFIALAIPKNDQGWPAIEAAIHGVAKRDFPNLFTNPNGTCANPQFAFKIKDGDGVDSKGNQNSAKEGFAGCWILSFTNGFAPDVYAKGGAQKIVDQSQVKRGDYIRVYADVNGNGSQQQPGVYLNMKMIEHIGYGEEIKSGPDAGSVFGGAPVAGLPAGASATPLAPRTSISQPVTAAPAPAPVTAAPAPAPVTAAPAPVTAAPAPVTAAPAPVTAAPVPAVPASQEAIMSAKAHHEGLTYAALKTAGWTDQQMDQHGYLDQAPF